MFVVEKWLRRRVSLTKDRLEYARRRWYEIRGDRKKVYRIFGAAALLVVSVSIVLVAVAVQTRNFDNRSRAGNVDGPAVVQLVPASSELQARKDHEIALVATTGGREVVGIQLLIEVSGKVPKNLGFTNVDVPGMEMFRNERVGNVFELVWLVPPTSEGIVAYQTDTPVTLGKFGFTAERSGTMSLSFDQAKSKIIDAQTGEELANLPLTESYKFSKSPGSSGDGGGKDNPNKGKGKNK